MDDTAGGPRFVPAAGRERLTALYDPVIALTMRERTFRGRLQAHVLDHLPSVDGCVVDVGAGLIDVTGTDRLRIVWGTLELLSAKSSG